MYCKYNQRNFLKFVCKQIRRNFSCVCESFFYYQTNGKNIWILKILSGNLCQKTKFLLIKILQSPCPCLDSKQSYRGCCVPCLLKLLGKDKNYVSRVYCNNNN